MLHISSREMNMYFGDKIGGDSPISARKLVLTITTTSESNNVHAFLRLLFVFLSTCHIKGGIRDAISKESWRCQVNLTLLVAACKILYTHSM